MINLKLKQLAKMSFEVKTDSIADGQTFKITKRRWPETIKVYQVQLDANTFEYYFLDANNIKND